MVGNNDTREPRIIGKSRSGIRIAALTCGALGMLLSTGCAMRVLNADFNKYTGTPAAGEDLDGPIPGLPEGDAIANTQDVEIVADEVIEGKSARVRGMMDLLPAEHTTPDMYSIKWEGMRTLLANNGNSTISFLDDDGDAALVLEFDGSDGRLYWRTGDESAPSVLLGSLTHRIDIDIDMRGVGSIDVSFKESDDVRQQHSNLDLLEPGFDELARIRFEGAANATYYVADLDVIAKSRLRRR